MNFLFPRYSPIFPVCSSESCDLRFTKMASRFYFYSVHRKNCVLKALKPVDYQLIASCRPMDVHGSAFRGHTLGHTSADH